MMGLVFSVIQISAYTQRANSNASVIGVWRVSEWTTSGPNGRKITNPQPTVIIFTRRYFSRNEVTSDVPRPELPAQGATDKQVADAFRLFDGEAATYEIEGNEITFKRIVTKNPASMRDGNFLVVTFRMEGNDTLWITAKANQNGPIANPTITRLNRLE
jgi:hypothetical protein